MPDEPFWLNLTINAVMGVAILGWGMYLGSRRELIWTLRHRAERAEAEQELRVAQARANERARIAREMHDVLAHRISQISMHAGALAFREDLTPDEMRDERRGHPGEGARGARPTCAACSACSATPTASSPSRRSRRTPTCPRWSTRPASPGSTVDFHDRLSAPAEVPDVARPHALPDRAGGHDQRPQARARLAADHRAHGLAGATASTSCCATRSASAARRPAPGSGLVGLTERAELPGGRLDAPPRGRRFVLHGWIPWAA